MVLFSCFPVGVKSVSFPFSKSNITIKIAQQHIKMKHTMRSVFGKWALALFSAVTQAGIEWISSLQASRK